MEIGILSPRIMKARSELEKTMREKKHLLGNIFPSILFSPLENDPRLGYFSPDQNLIVIREELALENESETRRNVFLHELAHAYAFHKFGSLSHDSYFRESCKLLGVPEGFEKAKIKRNLLKKEKARAKVEKLISLSSSPYENEAEEALKKARALLLEYNIEKKDEEEKDLIYFVSVLERLRFHEYEKTLLSITSRLTGAMGILEKKRGRKTSLSFYGNLEQIEYAAYLWPYLYGELEKEYRKAKAFDPLINKSTFSLGLATSLSYKLQSDKDGERAIAICQKENLDKFKRISGMITSRSRRSTSFLSKESFDKGFQAGKNIDITLGKGKWRGRKEIERR